MSEFVQIGDRIINKAHIIDIAYQGAGINAILFIFTDGVSVDGNEAAFYSWHAEQATELWEQLRHYLAPTVIHLNAAARIQPIPSPTNGNEDDDMPF